MADTRNCTNLDEELDSLLKNGYRLDMIMPADDPREAIVSRDGSQIRLVAETNPKSKIQNLKSEGRAGMEYRDLIPDRLDGRVIASHIRITKGGEVADYVHYHKVDFQMIYCNVGSIRVVYEDQGPPFILNAGDCVLQPPEICHRVLESSAGAEVIEVTSPAIHETWVAHDLELPTENENPGRIFYGQRFLRFVGSEAKWKEVRVGCEYADTGISDATDGLASVQIIRMASHVDSKVAIDTHDKRQQFIFVLKGRIHIQPAESDLIDLAVNGCCVLSAGTQYEMNATVDSEILQVALPAE